MEKNDHDSKIIDITPFVDKNHDHYDPESHVINRREFIRIKKREVDLININNRLSFIYMMINFLLVYSFSLTVVIFYLILK